MEAPMGQTYANQKKLHETRLDLKTIESMFTNLIAHGSNCSTVAVLGNTGSLVKTGYTFAGWNTAVNSSGTFLSCGDTFAMGYSDLTLYAQWSGFLWYYWPAVLKAAQDRISQPQKIKRYYGILRQIKWSRLPFLLLP